ncbi:hypothetical protein DXT88_22365 [Herbaspirillum lusitanum]|nr:hypothetical protein [Herbaspirillum lusitanum]
MRRSGGEYRGIRRKPEIIKREDEESGTRKQDKKAGQESRTRKQDKKQGPGDGHGTWRHAALPLPAGRWSDQCRVIG